MPIQANKSLLKQAWINEESFATTLVVCLIDTYGTEACTWAPETIRREINEDFNVDMPTMLFDRLMAGVLILTTDTFYESLPDFIDLCNILSGSPATPFVFSPADTMECAWGITEAILLSPPDNDEPFSKEIRAYIGKVVEMEGIVTPPDVLKIGLTNKDTHAKIHSDYSDDPELYSAIWGAEKSKTDDINNAVKGQLMALVNQLSVLQLANGNTADIAKKMLTNLQ